MKANMQTTCGLCFFSAVSAGGGDSTEKSDSTSTGLAIFLTIYMMFGIGIALILWGFKITYKGRRLLDKTRQGCAWCLCWPCLLLHVLCCHRPDPVSALVTLIEIGTDRDRLANMSYREIRALRTQICDQLCALNEEQTENLKRILIIRDLGMFLGMLQQEGNRPDVDLVSTVLTTLGPDVDPVSVLVVLIEIDRDRSANMSSREIRELRTQIQNRLLHLDVVQKNELRERLLRGMDNVGALDRMNELNRRLAIFGIDPGTLQQEENRPDIDSGQEENRPENRLDIDPGMLQQEENRPDIDPVSPVSALATAFVQSDNMSSQEIRALQTQIGAQLSALNEEELKRRLMERLRLMNVNWGGLNVDLDRRLELFRRRMLQQEEKRPDTTPYPST